MQNFILTMRRLRRLILIVVLICATVGIILEIWLQKTTDNERYVRICLTPYIANPIHAKVLQESSLAPIADAQVTIENTSPDQSTCPNLAYMTELHLTTDNTGEFQYVSGYVVHPNQEFTITITAPGCQDYHASNLSFGMLTQTGGLFLLLCD